MNASGVLHPATRFRLRPTTVPAEHLAWFAGGSVIAFAIPYLGTSVLDLGHDVYLGAYFVAVGALLSAYVRATGLDVRAAVRRNWKLNLALGLLVGFALVRNVFAEDPTPRPHGVYYAFELVWRGGIYGAVDALLLTAFPCMVVYSAMRGRLKGWRRRAGYALASLALVMTMTAVYHLGFEQYRQDGVKAPETGNVLISLPTLLTANPVASVADHAAMHISAVAHEYEGEVRLPPPADAGS
jgi:hypothetical protein